MSARRACVCVCKLVPVLFPCQLLWLITCHLPSCSTSSAFTSVVYEIAQQEVGRGVFVCVCVRVCVCFIDNATPWFKRNDGRVVIISLVIHCVTVVLAQVSNWLISKRVPYVSFQSSHKTSIDTCSKTPCWPFQRHAVICLWRWETQLSTRE